VKFLCDRCKTRYSIGDDRVRGKILKIRCKNCNNVITVREGMPEPGAVDAATRRNNPTQAIPLVEPGFDQPSEPAANGALGAAFASAMTKPPPALEEEWYVSIEGDQSGPFSLGDAQRWVASKPFDAELHCWSEGFDDWLPVDKVSHFRGLRKKPAPAPAPPPLPRAATGAVRAVARVPDVEDTPKPLFAATMAQLEKSVAEPARPLPLPSLGGLAGASTSAGGPAGMQARTNGSAARAPAKPLASQPAPPWSRDPSESATQLERPPFEDDQRTTAEPVAAAARAGAAPAPNDAFFDALRDRKREAREALEQKKAEAPPAAMPSPRSVDDGDLDGDGDLDIGEVSRVVNLADLARTAPRGTGSTAALPTRRNSPTGQLNRTGAIAKIGGNTAAVPRISGSEIGGPADLSGDPNALPPVALAPPPVSHRRGMIALVAGAVLLLGVAGAIVFFVMSDDDGVSGGLGGNVDYDITRPDDPRRHTAGGSAVADKTPQNPFVPKRNPTVRPPTNTTPDPLPTNPDAKALRPDEIEDMAAKNSGTTQRCYIRSQRGADAIILGDVRKLGVTLTVDPTGTVTDVKLSDHATTSLGKCLSSSIRGWKFRPSPHGITAKITMVFQSG